MSLVTSKLSVSIYSGRSKGTRMTSLLAPIVHLKELMLIGLRKTVSTNRWSLICTRESSLGTLNYSKTVKAMYWVPWAWYSQNCSSRWILMIDTCAYLCSVMYLSTTIHRISLKSSMNPLMRNSKIFSGMMSTNSSSSLTNGLSSSRTMSYWVNWHLAMQMTSQLKTNLVYLKSSHTRTWSTPISFKVTSTSSSSWPIRRRLSATWQIS